MTIYLVDFSLRATDHDYAPLWAALENAGAQRAMDTTWFVDVTQKVGDLTNALLNLVARGDRMLVVEIVKDAGWSATAMDEETKDWLKRRMNVITPPPRPVAAGPANDD